MKLLQDKIHWQLTTKRLKKDQNNQIQPFLNAKKPIVELHNQYNKRNIDHSTINLQIFFNIFLPNGMQERVQKKQATICPIRDRKTNPDKFYGKASPKTNVNTIAPRQRKVSTILVRSVMFLNCFLGVAKKHDLKLLKMYPVMLRICPMLQRIANLVVSCFITSTKTPRMERSQPTAQQTIKPISLVFIEHFILLLSQFYYPKGLQSSSSLDWKGNLVLEDPDSDQLELPIAMQLYISYYFQYYNINLGSIINHQMTKPAQNQKWQVIDGLKKFYTQLNQDNLELGDEGQSLNEFLSMKGVQPNQQGTGRVNFSDIKNIQCMLILDQKSKNRNKKSIQKLKKKICQLLTIFFSIPAKFSQQNLSFQNCDILDRHKNLQYSLKKNKQRFNALQLLDLLSQYKNQNSILISFIECSLHENNSDVYGRACGDGVAIIDLNIASSNQDNSKQIFFQTLLHQTLHTFGFDHCLESSCLMNPLLVGDLWLCPTCLKKLDSQMQLDLIIWISKLKEIYEQEMKQNKKLIKKTEKILQFVKSKFN